ncbi:MAG: tetratricopeptide repeat protein [Opitutaceae bacterium]|nr:tetratricopeptide repeat protein [Opitutaceae bacterium]
MKPRIPAVLAVACALMIQVFASVAGGSEIPLLDAAEIGRLHRPVTTQSPQAQRYFDQGLALLYSFDHDNAIRSFQEAARLDPACAMAWWGVAVACGPHINFPMVTPARAQLAWTALEQASRHAARGTPLERELIAAQAKRFAQTPPADRRPLDEAYADEMRRLWAAHPGDADIGVLFAEAMMNLRPWDLWQSDGSPHPGTAEIVATLAAVRKLAPDHPQAMHLTIHALEASPSPGGARAAADQLRRRQPGLGHMVHMPSHFDVLVGQWEEAVVANDLAVKADRATRERFGEPRGMLWLYMGHNRHMLAFAAMMTGRSQLALSHMDALLAELPQDDAWRADWGFLQDYFGPMRLEALVRFGRWDEVLAAPEPAESLPVSRTLRHAARAIAYAAKGRTADARREQAAFVAARARVPAEAFFGNNHGATVFDVAEAMVDGEILFREGRQDEGLARLREGVQREQKVRYNEPPDWIIPVRHALGAALMTAGRYKEAEQVFREDLRKWPDNGWSLFGLARTLRQLGRAAEAEPVEASFRRVWAKADIELMSSCLCLPGT